MRSIVKRLPEYDYVYLGDTARTPYGNRSQETIYAFTKQAVDFLLKKQCSLIILACNTASSEALRKLQEEYLPKHAPDKKVLGVLIPAVEEALKVSKNRRVGVIATKGTVASGAFVRELTKVDRNIRVFQKACPLLVPFIEAGEQNAPEMQTLLKRYLQPLGKKKIDTLILGCTHYGILERKIKKVVGSHVSIISEASIVPKKLEEYLKKHNDIEKTLMKNGEHLFYSTDTTDTFKTLGSKFFGSKIRVKKVEL